MIVAIPLRGIDPPSFLVDTPIVNLIDCAVQEVNTIISTWGASMLDVEWMHEEFVDHFLSGEGGGGLELMHFGVGDLDKIIYNEELTKDGYTLLHWYYAIVRTIHQQLLRLSLTGYASFVALQGGAVIVSTNP